LEGIGDGALKCLNVSLVPLDKDLYVEQSKVSMPDMDLTFLTLGWMTYEARVIERMRMLAAEN